MTKKEYSKILKIIYGPKVSFITDFFYLIDKKHIIMVCCEGNHVFCPADFNKSRPRRIDGLRIWDLYCNDPEMSLARQVNRIKEFKIKQYNASACKFINPGRKELVTEEF